MVACRGGAGAARSTSATVTTPSGPVPTRRSRSMSRSRACRRAAGEILRRVLSRTTGVPAGSRTGAGAGRGDVVTAAAGATGAGAATTGAAPAVTAASVVSRASAVPIGTSVSGSISSSATTPSVEYLEIDCALVGFNDGDDVAAVYAITRLDQPFDQRAGLHVGAERRHQKLIHRFCTMVRMRAAMPSTCGSAACSSCAAYGTGTSALHRRATGASSS